MKNLTKYQINSNSSKMVIGGSKDDDGRNLDDAQEGPGENQVLAEPDTVTGGAEGPGN